MTSIDLKLDLPDKLASQAAAAGLLAPRELEKLIRAEIKRQAGERLITGARKAVAAGSKPMSMKALQDVVDEVRVDRRNSRG